MDDINYQMFITYPDVLASSLTNVALTTSKSLIPLQRVLETKGVAGLSLIGSSFPPLSKSNSVRSVILPTQESTQIIKNQSSTSIQPKREVQTNAIESKSKLKDENNVFIVGGFTSKNAAAFANVEKSETPISSRSSDSPVSSRASLHQDTKPLQIPQKLSTSKKNKATVPYPETYPLPVSTFFECCTEYFQRPHLQVNDDDLPGGKLYLNKEWIRRRNERIVREAQPDCATAGNGIIIIISI